MDAETLFVDLVAGGDPEPASPSDVADRLSELCERYPPLAADLRRLHADWTRLTGVLRRAPDEPASDAPTHVRVRPVVESGPVAAGPLEETLERLAEGGAPAARYEVRQLLAEGGMGRILEVWDRELRRSLAMKVRRASAARLRSHERRHVRRFLDEAQITGQLDHPGIVPVHEMGLDAEGGLFFTMPLVRGRELTAVIDAVHEGEEGWSLTRAVGVLVRVCETVGYAHSRGVVHRDLKPANVMVGPFGETYVMDWGLARRLGEEDERDLSVDPRSEQAAAEDDSPLVTLEGDVVGTPCYMSPEQATGNVEELDARTDVYAIGALLYQLLSRRRPFDDAELQGRPSRILDAVRIRPPIPLALHAPDAPAELIAVCEKAMARDRGQRYASAAELGADLRAWLESRPVTARPPGLFDLVRLSYQRNRGVFWTAGTATLVVVVLLVGFVLRLQTALDETLAERGAKDLFAGIMAAEVLDRQEAELWPAEPAQVTAMTRWLERVDAVLAVEERFRGALAEAEDGGVDVDADELQRTLAHLERLRALRPVVADRLEHARTLVARTVDAYWDEWEAAIDDVATLEAYDGLELEPIPGLVPLQRNPTTGLWEFWHEPSGERPDVAPDGGVRVGPETGIVLVLVPGGAFTMGSPPDETGHGPEERQRDVVLAPFLMARHEVTQAQWARAMGSEPSYFRAGGVHDGVRVDARHPVESVSWTDAASFARRLGLALPTQAQWEFCCRAGTTTPWSWGGDVESLQGTENVADASALSAHPSFRAPWEDGFPITAPVGSLAPNPWGFYDFHGNVSEWGRDSIPAPEDGGKPMKGIRGGNWYFHAGYARSAFVDLYDEGYKNQVLGIRLALELPGS